MDDGVSQARPPDGSDLHSTVVENLFDGVYYVDRGRTITYWNPAAERITGYPSEEVVGRRCFDNLLRHVDDRGENLCLRRCPLVKAMAQRRGVDDQVYLHHRGGHRVPVHVRCQPVREPGGAVIGAVEIFNEDREYRDVLSRIGDLERMAATDPLTGLPNRRTAEMSIRSRQRDVQANGWPLGLLFVDVDGFKQLNDGRGHPVGDEVLRVVGRTIASSLREADLAARWGGDEFVVVSAAASREEIERLAERVRVLVRTSTATAAGVAVAVTVSIGATLAAPADSPDSLVRRADRAMYASKAAGRDRTTFAAPGV